MLRRLAKVVLVVVVIAMAREIFMDRAPERALRGTEPVMGSLDTWPEVPRRPAR
ncbi:MAG TPA: hypothetical protein VL961_02925 [Acidimicrobiales bacterium]|nr:hypothetical protein [Acidimicrobiales bacterium]